VKGVRVSTMFRRRKRERRMKLELQCTACGHVFKQGVSRLFMDLDAFEKKQSEPGGRSEYVIPERIVCPRCQAVDQFELTSSSRVQVQAEILKRIVIPPDPDDPLKVIRFALSDGTPMHPLDALDMYAAQVTRYPQRADVRVKYANTLRFLGYLEEAAAQYRAVLEQDPTEVEALVNLAALHAGRGEKEAAYECLHRLVACAPESGHPQRKEFASGARLVLDGEIALEDFWVEGPVEPLSTPARRPGSPPRRAPGRRKKRTRRSR
jgi:tetratricopeptide (TPR) repeat protein